ncbi:hypothetical protein Q9L42_017515 [Methylomarinum sp. Ch1-1]|uniref:Lipoprotein n=1 Tax=Methylomarinum roseum TaxID=3067653 RepID=A0AAU7NT44_9GAMM|nr:hypothetical protein [Methylomarinum sp. Ch1-1]MDP4519869.1 hypothetical protein [Methylomarinum sp. Ch1-1]
MNSQSLVLVGTVSIILAACGDANHRPVEMDRNFGQSVRQLTRAQIANPDAAEHPLPDSPRKMDGESGTNTMQGYRDAYGQQVISQPVIIDVGGSSSGN